ncbi:MAG: type II toxin-antitoxin system VapC family toxin [Terriglobales bacterium]
MDTNVLSALLSGESASSECKSQLDQARLRGSLVICAPVYAELCAYPGATKDFVLKFLNETGVHVDFQMSEAVWHETAVRFANYANRRRKSGGGTPKRMLVDFIVGAHALNTTERFLTLDQGRYVKDFPELNLV